MRHAILTLLLLCIPLPLTAATIHVPGDQPTIQAGIDAAVDGDIVLVADGWYAGPGNLNIDFQGKAITVRSENGAANCIVDCMDDGRGFIFQSGENEDSVLQGFTIRNGRIAYQGAGISCFNASPTITGNTLDSNFAAAIMSYERGLGGGIYLEGSSAKITGNTFTDNETENAFSGGSAYGYGGGIYATECSLEIIGNTFSGNWAYDGGGVYCTLGNGTTISGNLFSENHGGGMICRDTDSVITDNQVIGNFYGEAGGMEVSCSISGKGSLVSGNTISHNIGENAGGISVWGPVTVTDNLVSDNSNQYNHTWSGGGIACQGGAPTITGNIIVDNESVAFGAGINSSFSGPIIIGNVITGNFAHYAGGGIHFERGGSLISGNLISGNRANSGGGGIACFNHSNPRIVNNLIIDNTAGHDGGGVSVRYASNPQISNCTITGNTAANRGGAVALYNLCNTTVSNSILWGNEADHGREIFISGVTSDPSTLTIEWCDLDGGQPAVWVATGSSLFWGDGMIDADPLFASGPAGDHYLSQFDAGQQVQSPCVNGGDPSAVLVDGTTRTDEALDKGVVDMGYHYLHRLPGVRPLVITGLGPGPDNPPLVRAFPPGSGANHLYEFSAYDAQRYGVNVTCGDVNGDDLDEILTGSGPGEIYGAHVRGFEVDGTPLAGLSFFAYGTPRWGVNVAAGDLDGDSMDEILTGAGPGAVFGPHVRGFNYDGSGAVTPMGNVNFFAYGTPKWGVNVSCGDIDGDGYDEIVTGAGPGAVYGPHVRGWNVDGGATEPIPGVSFLAYGTNRMGVNVTCGDVDGDGIDEIVTAPGPSWYFGAHVRGWNFDGFEMQPLTEFSIMAWPYPDIRYGAKVFAGADLNDDGRDELVVGCGPNPDANTEVKVFEYDGSKLTLWFSLDAFPGLTHGTNVTAGRF